MSTAFDRLLDDDSDSVKAINDLAKAKQLEIDKRTQKDLESSLEEARVNSERSTQEAMNSLDTSESQIEHALAESMMEATDNLHHLRSAAKEFGYGWNSGAGSGVSTEMVEGLHELSDYMRKSKYLKMILKPNQL